MKAESREGLLPGWQAWLATFLASSRMRYLLLVALVLLYTGWIGYQWKRDYLVDFNLYYLAAYGFDHGIDIYYMGREYDTTNWPLWVELAATVGITNFAPPYLYPPLTAQLVTPLLLFSEQVAGMIWLALTALAFLISAWWLGKLWAQPEGASIVYLLTLGFVPFLTTLNVGQVNGFVLLALVAVLAGLAQRKVVQTGLALAIGSLLKVLPIVLFFYLVWRAQWRAALACVLFMVALMLTAPLTLATNVLERYFANFSATGRAGILYEEPTNQALSGFLARILLPVMEPSAIYQVYLISVFLLVAATIALCWPMGNVPSFWRFEFALILCTVILIPPYNWYHMLVLLLIPLVIVVEHFWRNQQWTLLAVVLFMYAVTNVHGLFYHSFENSRWLTSFPCGFVLLLWGLLAWMILVERKARRNVTGNEREEHGLLASVSGDHA